MILRATDAFMTLPMLPLANFIAIPFVQTARAQAQLPVGIALAAISTDGRLPRQHQSGIANQHLFGREPNTLKMHLLLTARDSPLRFDALHATPHCDRRVDEAPVTFISYSNHGVAADGQTRFLRLGH